MNERDKALSYDLINESTIPLITLQNLILERMKSTEGTRWQTLNDCIIELSNAISHIEEVTITINGMED